MLHPESVLMGKKATILLRPNILVNGRKAELTMLKNCKVELYSVNFIDNIPITQSFTNLRVSPSEEIEVKFQVPPHLKELKAVFSCEVNNITQNKMIPFTIEHSFNIVSNNSDYTIFDLYLRNTNGKYEIFLLGKNGEPLCGTNINI